MRREKKFMTSGQIVLAVVRQGLVRMERGSENKNLCGPGRRTVATATATRLLAALALEALRFTAPGPRQGDGDGDGVGRVHEMLR